MVVILSLEKTRKIQFKQAKEDKFDKYNWNDKVIKKIYIITKKAKQ